MLSDKMYNYYKNIRVTVTDKDLASVDSVKVVELYNLAEEDVAKENPARKRDEFNTDSEYKIYLIDLVECAGYKKLDIEPDMALE